MKTLENTRGDTRGFRFQRKASDGSVIKTAPDDMFITVKESWNTKTILFQKPMSEMTQSEDGYWHWHTEPADTALLPYGKYCGDLEVHKNGGIFTISKFIFDVTKEATWSSGEREY